MLIRRGETIFSEYNYTIPIIVDFCPNTGATKIIHGTSNKIRLSLIEDEKIRTISELNLKNICRNQIKGITFEDLNTDGNKELVLGGNSTKIHIWKLRNNNFEKITEIDLAEEQIFIEKKETIVKSEKENDQKEEPFFIRCIKFYYEKFLLLGTSYGLIILEKKNHWNFEIYRFLTDISIWNLKRVKNEKLPFEIIILSTDEGIMILKDNFEEIGMIPLNDRVYDAEIGDIDNSDSLKLVCGLRTGYLKIYELGFSEEITDFTYNEILNTKVVFEKDCGRKQNPAINCISLININSNEKKEIIIGCHDFRIKIFELEESKGKHILQELYIYDEPREEVYSLQIVEINHNVTLLLYSTYIEELTINRLVVFYSEIDGFTKKFIRELAKKINSKPKDYCFFLGAGFPYQKNEKNSAPLARDLIPEVFKKFNIQETSLPDKNYQNNLEYLLYYLKKLKDENSVKDYLQNRFHRSFLRTKSVKIIVKLIKDEKISQIFTTNFDRLIETSLKKINVYFKEEDFYSKNLKYPFYAKLHGCCSEPNSIIAVLDEIEKKDHLFYLKMNFLRFFYDSTNFIFIGYSLNDKDLFDAFNRNVLGDNFEVFFFDPYPNSNMIKVIDTRIKGGNEKFKFHIFKCRADYFFEILYEEFKNLGRERK